MRVVLLLLLLTVQVQAQNMKNIKSEGGRYQIMQLNDMARSQYLIDTHTGKIWNRQCGSSKNGECSYNVWAAEDVEGITLSGDKILQKAMKWDKINNPPPSDPDKK